MKGFLSLLALPALVLPALAAPATSGSGKAVVAVAPISDETSTPVTVLTTLLNDIKFFDAEINQTVAEVKKSATPAEKAAAAKKVNGVMSSVIDVLDNVMDVTKSELGRAGKNTKESLEIQRLVRELAHELGGTLRLVLTALPLRAFGENIRHLLKCLVAVLAPAFHQIDGLVEEVGVILDSLLGHLGLGGLLNSVVGDLVHFVTGS